jgi:hypothetical protein
MAIFPLQFSFTTRRGVFSAALQLALFAVAANVAAQTSFEEQGQLIKAPNAVARVGVDLFGDSLNMYTGSMSFRQTDVSLRGNNALPVAVGRRITLEKWSTLVIRMTHTGCLIVESTGNRGSNEYR